MAKLIDVWDFKPHQVYRISPAIDNPALRGRAVTFLGWINWPGCVKAEVGLLNADGSTGERWQVQARFIIPL